MCIIVGISGATNSGKTTLALKIKEAIPGTIIIQQDDYYYSPDSGNLEYIEELQFYHMDQLSAINMDQLLEDLKSVLTEQLESNTVVIVEGTLVLSDRRLWSMCFPKYYITIPYEEAKNRRERRNYDPPDVPGFFDKIVWPAYLKQKQEIEEWNDNLIILDGIKPVIENFQKVYNDLSTILENKT